MSEAQDSISVPVTYQDCNRSWIQHKHSTCMFCTNTCAFIYCRMLHTAFSVFCIQSHLKHNFLSFCFKKVKQQLIIILRSSILHPPFSCILSFYFWPDQFCWFNTTVLAWLTKLIFGVQLARNEVCLECVPLANRLVYF